MRIEELVSRMWSSLMFGGLFGSLVVCGGVLSLVFWDWGTFAITGSLYLVLVLLTGGTSWFLYRLSGERPSGKGEVTRKRIGVFALIEDSLFYTDDPRLQKNIEHITRSGPGEFSVEILERVDTLGQDEWVGVKLCRATGSSTIASEQSELVVDSGIVVIGCTSTLGEPFREEAIDAIRELSREGRLPYHFLGSRGGPARAVAFAPPYGDGAYPLHIERGGNGIVLTLLWCDSRPKNPGGAVG